jgi:hypothetical protein
MTSWRAWWLWGCGFVAGAVLASYLTLSCIPTRAQSAEVEAALRSASATYGVSYGCLRSIAWRESRFLSGVTNPRSGAAGLMQYLSGTWATLSRWAGYEGASPYDPWASAHVAAWAIANPWSGGLAHWGNRC